MPAARLLKQKGANILDVSASLVIFSISFLGTSQLLLMSMASSDESLQLSQVSWMGNDLMARISTMREEKRNGLFEQNSDDFNCATAPTTLPESPVPEDLRDFHLAKVFCPDEAVTASSSVDSVSIESWEVTCPSGCEGFSPIRLTITYTDYASEEGAMNPHDFVLVRPI